MAKTTKINKNKNSTIYPIKSNNKILPGGKSIPSHLGESPETKPLHYRHVLQNLIGFINLIFTFSGQK